MTTDKKKTDETALTVTGKLEAIERDIESRIALLAKVHGIIDRHINPATDINVVHGKLCRNIHFARKLFRLVGGSFTYLRDNAGKPLVTRTDHVDDAGPYYIYETFGRYEPPFGLNDVVEFSGMFSSRDDFFGIVDEELKPIEDVNEQNVRQASQSECFKKCVFTGLGLPPLEADRLQSAGIDLSKVSGYSGKGTQGRKGGSTDSEEENAVRAEIESICRDLFKNGWKDPATGKPCASAEDVLTAITRSKNGQFSGYRRFGNISTKNLTRTASEVTSAFAAFEGVEGAA